MPKYWCNLTHKQLSKINNLWKSGEHLKTKKPDWCNYEKATYQLLGCWRLALGKIHSKEDCIDCDRLKED